jgi:excisionase family DNA binding protein
MLTVPEAARRTKRDPETVRRWIRSGRLRATRIGTQHMIDEADLAEVIEEKSILPLPAGWRRTAAHSPMPDVVAAIRASRTAR